jgi:plasmid replication initiation protein
MFFFSGRGKLAANATKKQTATVLRFEPRFGTDELNLAEFPLAAIAHRVDPDQRTLTFEDEIYDEGNQQPVHRKLIISATEHSGLPTPLDSDVLLVLLYLTQARNDLTERRVDFTRYELVKMLNWDHGGKSYRRLDESLNRWASVTLYYNRAWWDRSGRKWRSRTFHVIESLDLRGRDGGADESLSSFTWNEVLFSSFQANNIKRLNLELYFRLRNAAAKQAYRFLDKRFFRTSHLEFDLRSFACEHVGFSRNYDSAQLKRRLQPALEELEEVGFLKPLPISQRYLKRGRGEWKIALTRANEQDAPSSTLEAVSPHVGKLTERGLSSPCAADLVRTYAAERIDEKIALYDWLVARKDKRVSNNPPGFLAESIRKDYPLPKDYVQAHRPVAIEPKPSIVINSPAEPIPVDDGFAAYWNSLTTDEQLNAEQEALAAAGPFHASTHQRLQASGGELFESFRQELVRTHLRGRGRLTPAA